MFQYCRFILAASLLAISTPALAHTGAGHVDSFTSGLAHPVLGVDHLLAMVAVGLWAALATPSLFWVAPAGFICGMLAGGIAGMSGFSMPGMEIVIGGSVILFGLLALFKLRILALMAFAAAGLFGSAHGFAHGAEMPIGGAALQYAAGFLLSTAALHLAGAAAGLAVQQWNLARIGQAAGGAVAAAGVVLMIAA